MNPVKGQKQSYLFKFSPFLIIHSGALLCFPISSLIIKSEFWKHKALSYPRIFIVLSSLGETAPMLSSFPKELTLTFFLRTSKQCHIFRETPGAPPWSIRKLFAFLLKLMTFFIRERKMHLFLLSTHIECFLKLIN